MVLEDDLTRIQAGGGLLMYFYPSFLQISSTPAPDVDISPTDTQKSTEDGLTTIRGGWLVSILLLPFIFVD